MDIYLKIFKYHTNKEKILIKSLDLLKEKKKISTFKFNSSINTLINKTFKNVLKDKYSITFKGNSIYFYPIDSIKENFIIKIEFIKDELSNTFKEYVIILNTEKYKNINLLLDILNITNLFSKKSHIFLLKINKFFNIHQKCINKITPTFIKTHKKLYKNKTLLKNLLLKHLLKSPLVFPSDFSPELKLPQTELSNIVQIQLNQQDCEEGFYNLLFTTSSKELNSILSDYNIKTNDIYSYIELGIIGILEDYSKYYDENLSPVE